MAMGSKDAIDRSFFDHAAGDIEIGNGGRDTRGQVTWYGGGIDADDFVVGLEMAHVTWYLRFYFYG